MQEIEHSALWDRPVYHTDAKLRRHCLFVAQYGFGSTARFHIVDADTYCPASEAQIAAYEAE